MGCCASAPADEEPTRKLTDAESKPEDIKPEVALAAEDEPTEPTEPTKKAIARNRAARATRSKVYHNRDVADDAAAYDESKWVVKEVKYTGAKHYISEGTEEEVTGAIAEGIDNFKANLTTYFAITYQTNMLDLHARDAIERV